MLAELLEDEAVPWPTLEARYGPVLELIRRMLGVVSNCDPYLEIWPPAYRARNVIVPNLLNMPFLLWGLGAPRSTVGLAMYVSSRTAGCAYCSAHSCSFALRRGATADAVAASLDGGPALGPADEAAAQVARGLSSVPPSIGDEDRELLGRALPEAEAEWVVLAIAMMGFLNKVNDALGVPLEAELVSGVRPVLAPTGWRPGRHLRGEAPDGRPPGPDSLARRLGVVRYAPQAVRLDRRLTRGVPDRWPEVGRYLEARTGHAFPVLSRLRHRRAVRAVATAIAETLGDESVVGRDQKLATGLVYAETVGNLALGEQLRAMGARPPRDPGLEALARAIAPSPAAVDGEVVEAARTLPAAGVVELVTAVSVLQVLHRLSAFYPEPASRA